jgi:pimeloyl-ACP methyl ester carboxylesterase
MKGLWIRKPSDGQAVVFLHGVLSSGQTCWTASSGAYWPSLLANEVALARVGVYVFSYETGLFSGSYRLGDVVDTLKELMRLDGLFDCRGVVFVAHSMGGIIARKLLAERASDFANCALGLFLVSSPSIGSSYANYIAPLARLIGHTQADALRFSQQNAWLMDLDKEFTNFKAKRQPSIVGKELVEDKFILLPGLIRKQVVEPFAGAKYFGEAIKIAGSNHFTIAKPASADSLQHRLLVLFLQEFSKSLGKSIDLDPEIEIRLTEQMAACGSAQVPFRAFHKLLVLLSTNARFAVNSFDAAGAGTAKNVADWCKNSIQTQYKDDREIGLITPVQKVRDDPLVVRARELAFSEGATSVDERHLLIALLEDTQSGTITKLARGLGPKKLERVRKYAQSERPRSFVQGESTPPSLTDDRR